MSCNNFSLYIFSSILSNNRVLLPWTSWTCCTHKTVSVLLPVITFRSAIRTCKFVYSDALPVPSKSGNLLKAMNSAGPPVFPLGFFLFLQLLFGVLSLNWPQPVFSVSVYTTQPPSYFQSEGSRIMNSFVVSYIVSINITFHV
jgi:hypothetical protein